MVKVKGGAPASFLLQNFQVSHVIAGIKIVQSYAMIRNFSQADAELAGLINMQRNMIYALAAIISALPKESINREAALKNLNTLPLFAGVVQSDAAVKEEVEKLVDQILGQS